MKTIEALNALAALNNVTADTVDPVSQARTKRSIPSKFAYACAINRKRLTEVAEAFEEGRKSLLEQFGAKDADGKLAEKDGQVTITDPLAFHAEYAKLGEVDTEVKLHQVALESFPEEIALADMDALMPMVSEDAA